MKHSSRLIFSVLVLALFLQLCACAGRPAASVGETTAPSGDGSGANPYESIYRTREDQMPSLDYEGEEILFLTVDEKSLIAEISVEEQKSEPLNDAIYYRNIYVEDRLGVQIETEAHEISDCRDILDRTLNSGDNNFQVYAHQAAPLLQNAYEDAFYNLRALQSGYMELDAPWYSQSYIEEMGNEETLFGITGAMSLSMLRSLHVTYFNKRVAEDCRIEDLYQVVEDGRWTIDYEGELISDLYRDLNGNSEADAEDFYGLLTNIYWATDAYWTAFDIDFLARDTQGDFYFNLNTEKLFSALEKISALDWSNPGTFHSYGLDEDKLTSFAEGRALFFIDMLWYAESVSLRDMVDDYGVLPIPKYEEAQADYYTGPYEVFQMYAIPVTVPDPDMVSAVLEEMFAESWCKVVPIYSDIALKGKYMSDPQSRLMFDRIIDGMRFEAGLLYTYSIAEAPSDLMRYVVSDRALDRFGSTLAKIMRHLDLHIAELNEKLK